LRDQGLRGHWRRLRTALAPPMAVPCLGALKFRLGAMETEMPAIFSTIILPAGIKGPGIVSRLLVGACERIAGYFGRRTAIACLHELDDRALRDIGIGRYQIEAAVYGLITFSGHADEGMVTPAANQRERQHAPTMEAAPWS